MTLRDAVLARRPGAVIHFFDRARGLEKNYWDTCEMLRRMFREAGRPEPDDATIDAWIREEEEGVTT